MDKVLSSRIDEKQMLFPGHPEHGYVQKVRKKALKMHVPHSINP